MVCISALKGAVIQTSLAVDSQKTKIEKGSIQSLFQGTDKGLLLTIGSQDKDASEQAQKLKKVELVVNGLSNGRWSIRIGNTIAISAWIRPNHSLVAHEPYFPCMLPREYRRLSSIQIPS